MFVRKKPNKSGKVSVQVLLKSKSRKQQVVKTVDYLERYLHVRYDVSKIYRFLDNLCYRKEDGKDSAKEKPEEPDFKHLVENISFDYTKRIVGGDISV